MAGIFSLQVVRSDSMLFFVKISKGDEVGDTFIGNMNHSCIGDEIDHVVGLDPGIEGSISSNRHDIRR